MAGLKYLSSHRAVYFQQSSFLFSVLGNFPSCSQSFWTQTSFDYGEQWQNPRPFLKYNGITKPETFWLLAHSAGEKISWLICNTGIIPCSTNGKISKEIISEIKVTVSFMSTWLERHFGMKVMGKTNPFSRSHCHTYTTRTVIFLRSAEYCKESG